MKSPAMADTLNARPLHFLRVLELSSPSTIAAGRLVADLGAELIAIDSRHDSADSLRNFVAGLNKAILKLPSNAQAARQVLHTQLARADVLIYDGRDPLCEALRLSTVELKQSCPRLTLLSVSDFGLSGPYKDYQATNAVHLAMTATLARSGIEGNRPLLPPGQLAWQTAAAQAVWALMVALWQRSRIGTGIAMDCSIFEGVAQVLDPGLGVTGSGSAGRSAGEMAPYGRPPVGWLYPIIPCADGHVRACILNPRQWENFSKWLGNDHPFTDPKYSALSTRYPVIPQINALMAEFFADRTTAEVVEQARQRGIPISPVASPAEARQNPQFLARKAFCSVQISGKQAQIPSGYLELDGVRLGLREPTNPELPQRRSSNFPENVRDRGNLQRRPFSDLRILDLGVIVAGAELGRLFADMGADVIKVENSAFADGLRQSPGGAPISLSFTQGSRNKQSLGLNLRSPVAIDLFKQLVKKSDVVLSNFKPGTLESLGIDYATLSAINPRIVVAESSALGNTGPMAKSMGYGPLVRASCGLTGLWRYPDTDNSFSDSITIFPDHFAARIAASGIVAALLRREITGRGGRVIVSQAETILNALASEFLAESLAPASLAPRGNISPLSAINCVYPCAGDDQWCVIDFRDDTDWRNFVSASGISALATDKFSSPELRRQAADEIAASIERWTRGQLSEDIVRLLQSARVPCGKMLRLSDLSDDPHLVARRFFRQLDQPGYPQQLQTENGPAGVSELPDPEIRPAPFQSQHTRSIVKRLLAIPDTAIDALIADGVLEDMSPALLQYLKTPA